MSADLHDTLHDPRLRQVKWLDLVRVTPLQVVFELLLPAIWLAASLVAAAYGQVLLALGLSFMFFLTGLRLIHNAFHAAVGLPRFGTELVLWAMSAVILGSMHAVRHTHLTHHRVNLSEEDVEGRHAQMPGWRALLQGPYFTLLMHVTALRHGRWRLRATIAGQLLMNAALVTLAFRHWDWMSLRYHVCAMGVRIGISNARPVQGCPQPLLRIRPYVASKLRSHVACRETLAASRPRRRAFGRCRATKPACRAARMAPTPAFAVV